jgi:RHS repeat-associated protein
MIYFSGNKKRLFAKCSVKTTVIFLFILTLCTTSASAQLNLLYNAGIQQQTTPILAPKSGDTAIVSNLEFINDFSTGSSLIDSTYIKNIITLRINEYQGTLLQKPLTVSVVFRLYFTGKDGNVYDSVNSNQTLAVNFDTAKSSGYNTSNSLVFYNGYRTKVKVINLNISDTSMAGAVELDNSIAYHNYYKFDCSASAVTQINILPVFVNTASDIPDELPLSWQPQQDVSGYDLEWTYIDSSAIQNNKYGSQGASDFYLNIFRNNATRVNLTDTATSYHVPLLYDKGGVLFVRLRSVQNLPDGRRMESDWKAYNSYGFGGHQNNLNWQASTSFAEEGKRKSVVQYYDGSLRSRQTVTKDNSTGTTVVAESFYDYQGRPVIQVLPAPTLNKLIQYTPGFNSINNAEYDKTHFDRNIASYVCSSGADSLSSNSGSSQYYSPNNPNKSNSTDQWIPDAKDYPFTETKYMADNTGRISSQGGVGVNHQIGSGHETKYYYGNPDQTELDALFGNEAGYANHYFKNMVRDANGQYSISYTDMHGRTIATALAGSLPSGVNLADLDSKNQKTLTKVLTDSTNNIIKDYTIESSKTLIITKPGGDNVQFNYSLPAAKLSLKDCNNNLVDYNCLYDLEISISADDDCNKQILGGATLVRTYNNISSATSISFTQALNEGTYTVTKKLTINKAALEYYRDTLFKQNNLCKTQNDFFRTYIDSFKQTHSCTVVQDCNACRTALGTYSSFRNSFITQNGWDSTNINSQTETVIQAEYNKQLANCDLLCNKTTNELDQIRSDMLGDLVPGTGQYADLNNIDDASVFSNISYSQIHKYASSTLLYTDAAGNPDTVYVTRNNETVAKIPNELTPEEFTNNFKPSWAETLLPLHPEYARLQYAQNNITRSSYDLNEDISNTKTFSEAYRKGYLNPTNSVQWTNWFSSLSLPVTANPAITDSFYIVNPSLKMSMNDSLRYYYLQRDPSGNIIDSVNLWGIASAAGYCKSGDLNCTYTNRLLPFADTTSCSGNTDFAWQAFASMYLAKKKTFIQNAIGAISTSADITNHTSHFVFDINSTINQQVLGGTSGTGTSSTAINAQKEALIANQKLQYEVNAASYASIWWSQLAPCTTDKLKPDSAEIINHLIRICVKGSDMSHPNGSVSIAPDSSYQFKNFDDVIAYYVKKYNQAHSDIISAATCNAQLITYPLAYSAPALTNQITIKPDSCQCSLINNLYVEFGKYATTSDINVAAYINRTRNTNITQGLIDSLHGLCNGTISCNFISSPIIIPPALQCGTGGVSGACASCSSIIDLFTNFKNTYPDANLTVNSTDVNYLNIFANYMNRQLGFNKKAIDYLKFIDSCNAGKHNLTQYADTVLATNTPYTVSTCFKNVQHVNYSSYKAFIYADEQDNTGTEFADITGGFWLNAASGSISDGRLNRAGIWPCGSIPDETWVDATVPVFFPHSGIYYFGLAGDNQVRISINDTLIKEIDQNTYPFTWETYTRWNIYPYYVTKGYHNFKVEGWNEATGIDGNGQPYPNPASFAAEIYDADVNTLRYADSTTIKNSTLFTTASLMNQQSSFNHYGCPINYDLNKSGNNYYCTKPVCIDTVSVIANPVSLGTCYNNVPYVDYGSSGAYIYSSIYDNTGTYLASDDESGFWDNPNNVTADGKLNRVGIWTCNLGENIWTGVTVPVYFPQTGNYYFGMGGDDKIRTLVDGNLVKLLEGNVTNHPFLRWNIYPYYITKGYHNITVEGYNVLGSPYFNPALFGAEIYNATADQLRLLDTTSIKNLTIFSTLDILKGKDFSKGCPEDYALTVAGGHSFCSKIVDCNTAAYPDYQLCDTTRAKPVFNIVLQASVAPACSDSANWAAQNGTIAYHYYSDSLKGSFEQPYLSKCFEAVKTESFTAIQTVSEYHYTLYYYDQAGNLVKTVPPAGVHPNYDAAWLQQVAQARNGNQAAPANPAHTLVTEYKYNTLNQVITQKTPDAGISKFWYDRLGRLALSQNAKQLTEGGNYSYTLYDALGRITEVGQINAAAVIITDVTDNTTRTESTWQQWLANNNSNRYQVTNTVYDVAATASIGPWMLQDASALRNRVSYSSITPGQKGTQPVYATYYSYDVAGNVKSLLHDYGSNSIMTNAGQQYKRIDYAYDLVSGKVNRVSYQPGKADAFIHLYQYDAENRITDVYTTADSVQLEHEAHYSYYKHGPLAQTVLGNNRVQSLTYAYTLQGWLKGVNPVFGGFSGVNNASNCAPGSAVTDLVVNSRSCNTPFTYTAQQTITFDNGFESAALTDSFQTQIDATLPLCKVATDSLQAAFNNPANPVYGYSLHYFTGDYQPIGINTPTGLLPALGRDAAPLYNGNIAAMAINIPVLGDAKVYNYHYDQLNRLVAMDAFNGLNPTAGTFTPVKLDDYKERISYDANGNILSYVRHGSSAVGLPMDSLKYQYVLNSNKLDHVHDDVTVNGYTEDIKNQDTLNYNYDAIGNLTKDIKGGVDVINWNVYGKINSITKGSNTISYQYDAAGNRISKTANGTTTWYVRDAQGNVLSVYSGSSTMQVQEQDIYGSSRLGIVNNPVTQTGAQNPQYLDKLGNGHLSIFSRGKKLFELSNHLGNVQVTLSDKKLLQADGNYNAEVASANDYYPGGMLMPGRTYNAGSYTYGFNGKRKDNEIYGEGNAYDFGSRVYDPRIGRWLSTDPLWQKYTSLSPYNFVANSPIQAFDPDGKLIIFVNGFRERAYANYLLSGHSKDFPNTYKAPWEYRPLYSKADIFGNKNGSPYWSGANNLFIERYHDNNTIYVDGGYKPHSTAQERYDRGVSDALSLIQKIDSKEIELKQGETIKLVGHSHGGWHSVGMADALSALGYPIEAAYIKNPHQPDGLVKRLEGRKDFRLVQFSTPSDNVSSDQSKLDGIPLTVPLGKTLIHTKIPLGDWLVGDSKYAQIPGAEFRSLPYASKSDLGGHPVDEQMDYIKKIPSGEKGHVGPQLSSKGGKNEK